MISRTQVKLIAGGAGFVVLIGLLLAAPSLIDWTEYRAGLAQRLSAVTSRAVSIDGDVDFVLLPRPAFNAEAVRIGGGNLADDFVAVERLSARLAFLPLLTGELKFREVVLRRPEARMTRNQAGNVDFLTFPAPAATAGAPAPPPAAPFDLDIDRVVIDDGALTFEDVGNAAAVNIKGIDVTLTALPQKPTTLSGEITAGTTPLAIEAVLGRAGTGGVSTLSLAVKLAEAEAAAKFSGTLTRSPGNWDLRGDLSGNASSTSSVLAALGLTTAGTALPEALQKPLSVKAKMRASATALSIDPLALDIGGTPAKGILSWQAGSGETVPHVSAKFEVGAVQVEAWRFAENKTPASFNFGFVATAYAQTPPVQASSTISLPLKNLAGDFSLKIPALSYRGQTLRDANFTAMLANSELTISDLSVELPAATRAKAFGLIRLDGDRVFEGALEAQTGDLRGMLAWLGVKPDNVPLGRLSNASFKAALQVTPAQFTLGDITATVDTSTLTGRLGWLKGPRPLWNVDLTVNTLNADVYLPLFKQSETPASVPAAVPTAPPPAASPPPKADAYGVTPVFAAFADLPDIDADVRLQVDSLTFGGVGNGKAGVDASLKDGTLALRSISFENVGGATAWFSGGIGGFGVTPRIVDLQFDVSAVDLPRVGRAFGINVPEPLRSLTPLSLMGVINGSLAQADMTATLKIASLIVQASGQGLTLDQQPHITLDVEAAQPSYAALMKAAGFSWPIGTADPGAVKVSAHITHEPAATKIESLAVRIGENTFTGVLDIVRGPGLPEVTGTLTGITLTTDKLWPKPGVVLSPSPPVRTASARPAVPSAKPPPWSQETFDWSLLKGWRGNIQLAGASLTVRGVQVQDFSCHVMVADDAAEITEWKGKVFGAPGQLYVRAAASPVPLVQGEIAFLGGDLGGVANAINGGGAATKSMGKADFAGSFRAQGANPEALAAAFSGSGTLKITASEAGSGTISGLLGAITAANQVEGFGKAGPVTLESRFSAEGGRIKIEDATVASKSYGGAFTGTIDLAQWQVDLAGRLRLESRAADAVGKPAAVPITIKGQLDLPNIMLRPAS